jgi:hypothetical protein
MSFDSLFELGLITWESDCPLALIEFIPDSEDSNDA